MKKFVIGMQIIALLSSFAAFSQASYSPEMLDRNLKQRKMIEDNYKASQIKNAEIAEQERKKKAESDSLLNIKNLELKKINEEKEAKYQKEIADRNKEEKEKKIKENSASEDKNKESFSFDKIALARLEKELKYSNYYDEKTKELYSSIIDIDSIAIKNNGSAQFVKISSFLPTDKFVSTSWSLSDNAYYVIKNIKTQKLYAIHTFVRFWTDYSPGADAAHKDLIKYYPKAPTAEEHELIERYKGLIKSSESNTNVLSTIQKRCLTRGYFDEKKMNAADKQTWNKNILALKVKYGKLSDIDRFEDKDDKAQNKLTISELGQLNNVNTWLSNFSTIK